MREGIGKGGGYETIRKIEKKGQDKDMQEKAEVKGGETGKGKDKGRQRKGMRK